jgi:hypothetical protein
MVDFLYTRQLLLLTAELKLDGLILGQNRSRAREVSRQIAQAGP